MDILKKPNYLSRKPHFLYLNISFPLPLITIVVMSFVVLTQISCDNMDNNPGLNNIATLSLNGKNVAEGRIEKTQPLILFS